MKFPYARTLAAIGLCAAIGPAAAAQASGTVFTRSADALDGAPGRAGSEVFWMQRADVGVHQVVKKTYANTRAALSNPRQIADPDRYGRGGGYVGLDRFHALDWQIRSGMTSPDAS